MKYKYKDIINYLHYKLLEKFVLILTSESYNVACSWLFQKLCIFFSTLLI